MLGRRRQQVLAGRRREQIEKVFKADALGLRNMQLRGCLGAGADKGGGLFHRSGESTPFTASAAMMEAKCPQFPAGSPCSVHPAAAVKAAGHRHFHQLQAAPPLQEIKLMKSSCSCMPVITIRSGPMVCSLSASAVSSSAVQPDSR